MVAADGVPGSASNSGRGLDSKPEKLGDGNGT